MKPLQTASLITAIYLLVSIPYIIFSSSIAAELSGTVVGLSEFETAKGLVYVLLVGGMLFGLIHYFSRRIADKEHEAQKTREKALSMERRMLAGTLSASIAHDMSNMLAVVTPNLQLVLAEDLPEEIREPLEDARTATTGLNMLSKRLSHMAHAHVDAERRELDLSVVVDDSIRMIRTHSKVVGCKVDLPDSQSLPMTGFPTLVTHAVINLVLNAADATGGDGSIRVRHEMRNDCIAIEVHDDGPGVAPDQREVIRQPYHTDRSGGTGLGLFAVEYCAEAHGGEFDIEDSPELGGALMRLELPLELTRESESRPSLVSDSEPLGDLRTARS